MGKYLLGLNNGWVTKRFTEPEAWAEIAATTLEIDLIQFSFDLLDPMSNEDCLNEIIPRTIDACKKYGITLQSCFTGGVAYNNNLLLHPSEDMRKYAFDWYSRAIDIAGKLRAEDVGGHMGALTVKDYKNNERRESLLAQQLKSVKDLSQKCKDVGVKTLLWEIMPVPREPPSTISQARCILKELENTAVPVQLCIDVGHTCNPHPQNVRDNDPYVWLKELGSKSPCIHVQQTDGKGDRHWPFTKKFNKIGIIEGRKVLAALDASEAGGTYIYPETFPAFEQDDDQVIQDMRETVRYWKEFM